MKQVKQVRLRTESAYKIEKKLERTSFLPSGLSEEQRAIQSRGKEIR